METNQLENDNPYIGFLNELKSVTTEQVKLIADLQSNNVALNEFVKKIVDLFGEKRVARGKIRSSAHLASDIAKINIPRYPRIVCCLAVKEYLRPQKQLLIRAIADSLLSALTVNNSPCSTVRKMLDKEWHKTDNDVDAFEIELVTVLTESWKDAIDYKHILCYISRLTAIASWHGGVRSGRTADGKQSSQLLISIASGVHSELATSVNADIIKQCARKTRSVPFYKGIRNGDS